VGHEVVEFGRPERRHAPHGVLGPEGGGNPVRGDAASFERPPQSIDGVIARARDDLRRHLKPMPVGVGVLRWHSRQVAKDLSQRDAPVGMELRDDDLPRRVVLEIFRAGHAQDAGGFGDRAVGMQCPGEAQESAHEIGIADGNPLAEQPVEMGPTAREERDAGRDREGHGQLARLILRDCFEIDVHPERAHGQAILQLAAGALAVGDAEKDVGARMLREEAFAPRPVADIGKGYSHDATVGRESAQFDLALGALEQGPQEILTRHRQRTHAALVRSCSARSDRSDGG